MVEHPGNYREGQGSGRGVADLDADKQSFVRIQFPSKALKILIEKEGVPGRQEKNK